jgi:lipoprotein-anchoring transpeptidase ErfK/SrfK
VVIHRAQRRVDVERGGRIVASFAAGIGSVASPTPAGRFFVTERVAVPSGRARHAYGSFAFGLSGLQSKLPAGWTGGDQLAIHGTGDASSIGRASSAGCVRLAERSLQRLRRWLVPGTPVEIR